MDLRLKARWKAVGRTLASLSLGAAVGTAALAEPLAESPSGDYREAYEARRPKSAIDLQPFRSEARAAFAGGSALLIDLNPEIGSWYVLSLERPGEAPEHYHLELRDPARTRLRLDPGFGQGLVLREGPRESRCELWSSPEPLAEARGSGRSYAPLCDGRVFLRNPTEGRKTTLEWTTDFLRRNVPGGEAITVFVRETFFQDAFLETSDLVTGAEESRRPRPPGAPQRAALAAASEGKSLLPAELGIPLGSSDGRLLVGRWYPIPERPGTFVSAVEPRSVAELPASMKERASALDQVEATALVYLVAFDLERFELGFELGTDHPRVGWSDRTLPGVRDEALPGPDGIDSTAPLVMTGKLPPALVERVAAAFTGGFKRTHGAFKWGRLAHEASGSHYGFIQHGTILSKLQPGLATLLVGRDGRVELRTWSTADDPGLSHIRHARQNGVALIEPDPLTGQPRPGDLVRRWGEGNWSGSQDEKLRTVRAGVALQESDGRRFLLYGYFSSATPSAMARVFQAYGCSYAMMLDINALEHTYLAIYRGQGVDLHAEHLVKGMNVLDKREGERELPRFIAFSDNRDFFYLLRKGAP